jgi:ubiquinone/menaquinone biosynthesis C-methylase UbiE
MLPLELMILRRLRRQAFAALQGDVLEVGAGTGVNLPFYGPDARVTGCDASEEMLGKVARRRAEGRVALVRADVQRLPFAGGSFGAVAASLTFCSVADPVRALVEARRVLRQGGLLVLLEHTRGSGAAAWLTDLLNPLWHAWSGECHLNRETAQSVAEAGFDVRRVARYVLGIFRVIEATA